VIEHLILLLMMSAASARLAVVISKEKITDGWRAYIEARWPRSFLDRLISCPRCVSHWTSAALAIILWPYWATWQIALISWLAMTQMAITIWINNERNDEDNH
jgi:hypothetical protein